MQVIEGKFGKTEEETKRTPSECLELFSKAAKQVEEEGGDNVETDCIVLYWVNGDMHLGGTPEGITEVYMMLDLAKNHIIDALVGRADYTVEDK